MTFSRPETHDGGKPYCLGLKLWSTNTGPYVQEAQRLHGMGLVDYVELYAVPDSLDTIPTWQKLDIPFTIHVAHSGHGFNLADPDKEHFNRTVYAEARQFADALNADWMIFHGGNRGSVECAARQLASYGEPRAVIENKPYYTLRDERRCIGTSPEEIRFIKQSVGCGFCLDFGHAACSAAAQGTDAYDYFAAFMEQQPVMFHLSGVKDLTSWVDKHLSLCDGQLDGQRIAALLPRDAKITLETPKKSSDSLDDFRKDVEWIRSR